MQRIGQKLLSLMLSCLPALAVAEPAVPPLPKAPKGLSVAEVEAANRKTAAAIVRRTGEPQWASIAIHHTAFEAGSLKSIDNYHRKRFSDPLGIEYQFLIGNGKGAPDGYIELARWRTGKAGVHAVYPERAPRAITISLMGNLDKRPPSAAQAFAVELLTRHLQALYNIDDVRVTSHNRIDGTVTLCPGRMFPMERLQWRLKNDADVSMADWQDPHASFPQEGPFADLDALRTSLQWGPVCRVSPAEPGPFQTDKRLAGSGPLLEARLLRIRGAIGCAPNDRQFIALHTKAGWYATELGAYRPVRLRLAGRSKDHAVEVVDVGVATLRCHVAASGPVCRH